MTLFFFAARLSAIFCLFVCLFLFFFMQRVTMVRLRVEKACYMANSIDETLTPADLKEALEMVSVL